MRGCAGRIAFIPAGKACGHALAIKLKHMLLLSRKVKRYIILLINCKGGERELSAVIAKCKLIRTFLPFFTCTFILKEGGV